MTWLPTSAPRRLAAAASSGLPLAIGVLSVLLRGAAARTATPRRPMADEPEQTIRHHVPLPEGSMPLAVVELVEYLTPDGERVFGYRHAGGTGNISSTLGLIELMKRQVVQSAYFPGED